MKKIIILILFLSCFSIKENTKKVDQSIIMLERTACFGTCPIYKIEIYAEGNGIFTGTKYVEKIGVLKFNITTLQVKEIIDFAKEINFRNMEERYYEPITDLPTTYIKIEEKIIEDYFGAPRKLKELENLIDQIVFNAI